VGAGERGIRETQHPDVQPQSRSSQSPIVGWCMGSMRPCTLGACQVNRDAASELCLLHDCHFRLFVRKKKLIAIPDAKYKLNTGQGKTIQQISRATSATKYTIFSP
jgi:hypothetical protein